MYIKLHLCLFGIAIALLSGSDALKCYQCGGIGNSKSCESAPSLAPFEKECNPLGPELNVLGHVIVGENVCFTSSETNYTVRGCEYVGFKLTKLGWEQKKFFCNTDLCNSARGLHNSSLLFIITLFIAFVNLKYWTSTRQRKHSPFRRLVSLRLALFKSSQFIINCRVKSVPILL